MKPPSIPLECISTLDAIYRIKVPDHYLDENGHMNIRWYVHIFDDAGYPFVGAMGLTIGFHKRNNTGGFDLEHHIHYLNEVHAGDTVAIYARLLGRSAKRMHYMMFMVNETRQLLASTFECVNSFADLAVRKTAPYPNEIAQKIDALLAKHNNLTWEAPVCGVMNA